MTEETETDTHPAMRPEDMTEGLTIATQIMIAMTGAMAMEGGTLSLSCQPASHIQCKLPLSCFVSIAYDWERSWTSLGIWYI